MKGLGMHSCTESTLLCDLEHLSQLQKHGKSAKFNRPTSTESNRNVVGPKVMIDNPFPYMRKRTSGHLVTVLAVELPLPHGWLSDQFLFLLLYLYLYLSITSIRRYAN
jgi:hypothetical protein